VAGFSVIVPAKNAAQDLKSCLSAITKSLPTGGEVIVVDDGSIDETPQIAEAAGAIIVRSVESRGAATARNLGVAAAQGEILVFLDADVIVHPDTIARLLAKFEGNTKLAAVMGSYDDSPLHKTVVSEFRNLLHHYVHHQGNKEAVTFWTGCGAMRRRNFDEVGGFVNGLLMEDIDLGLRVTDRGGRIELDPTIQVKHRKRWTLRSMIVTDVFSRAIPWMKLMEGRRGMRNDLNTRWEDRVSALLVMLGILLIWRWEGWVALALATAVRWDWHWFLVRKRGWWFALRAMPLHWLYLFYSTLAFSWMKVRALRPLG